MRCLPKHLRLSLTHNACRGFYMKAAAHITERPWPWEWPSEEEKARAAETNEIWLLSWTNRDDISAPEHVVAGSTLDAVLVHIDGRYPTDPALVAPLVFPRHAAGLHLEHNEFLVNADTLAECWELMGDEPEFADWISDEQKAQALARNDVWTLQWYPNTPIGFNAFAAHDLSALVAAAVAADEANSCEPLPSPANG